MVVSYRDRISKSTTPTASSPMLTTALTWKNARLTRLRSSGRTSQCRRPAAGRWPPRPPGKSSRTSVHRRQQQQQHYRAEVARGGQPQGPGDAEAGGHAAQPHLTSKSKSWQA